MAIPRSMSIRLEGCWSSVTFGLGTILAPKGLPFRRHGPTRKRRYFLLYQLLELSQHGFRFPWYLCNTAYESHQDKTYMSEQYTNMH